MALHTSREAAGAAQEPRTVEGFQARVQALAEELDTFVLDRERSLTAEARHGLEDARTSLLRANRDLGRAHAHRRRRKRQRTN